MTFGNPTNIDCHARTRPSPTHYTMHKHFHLPKETGQTHASKRTIYMSISTPAAPQNHQKSRNPRSHQSVPPTFTQTIPPPRCPRANRLANQVPNPTATRLISSKYIKGTGSKKTPSASTMYQSGRNSPRIRLRICQRRRQAGRSAKMREFYRAQSTNA